MIKVGDTFEIRLDREYRDPASKYGRIFHIEDTDSYITEGELICLLNEGKKILKNSRNTMCDIYVRDKYHDITHRVGSDRHDSIWVDDEGTLHYHNLQNGDGCSGYKSRNEDKVDFPGREDEYKEGYEFVPSYCGETDIPFPEAIK